jgi:hypothetical protein
MEKDVGFEVFHCEESSCVDNPESYILHPKSYAAFFSRFFSLVSFHRRCSHQY